MKRTTVFIYLIISLNLYVFGQNDSKMYALKSLHDAFWTQKDFDINSVIPVLSAISDRDVENSSDSLKYYYHYWQASVYSNKNQKDLEREHLLKAISLREHSVGILDPEYIELLWELGTIFEDEDTNKSIKYYQKALVIGQTILYCKDIPAYNVHFMQNTYGMVLGDLARMYEKNNWKDRVEGLYESAFSFRSHFNNLNDAGCYVDLYALANYYRDRKEFGRAVETMRRVTDYIKNNGGYGSDGYVNASFMLASALSQNNQHSEALNLYKKTISLAIDSLGQDNKNLQLLYGNYCIELANSGEYENLSNILSQAQSFYIRTDSVPTYINVLFTISKNLCDREQYEKAAIFNDSLFLYTSYMPDMAKEILYSQRTQIELAKGNIQSAIENKQKELAIERNNDKSDKLYYLSTYSELATLYSYNNQPDEALDIYKEVLASLENDNMEENKLYERCFYFTSNIYSALQRPDLLQQFLLHKKQLLTNKHSTQSAIFAQICNNLSVLQMQTNQLDGATENNDLVLPLFLNLYGKQSDNYATALHNKGRILMLKGKNKQALELLNLSKQIQLEINNSVHPNTEKYIQELESKK